jgi:2-amino-4-hydroxy-6-hydroxymethyldihydropteridine diphosphokinase
MPNQAIHEAGIGLGSNQGESLEILQTAWRRLQNHPSIDTVVLSAPYRSQPVDMVSASWFINAAALVRTTLAPYALLRELQAIEISCGRVRPLLATDCQDRTLDLDLLFYDELIFDTDDLVIPHPRMHCRLFVLEPLVTIAGDRIHSFSGKQMRELLLDLKKINHNQLVERMLWPG